MKRELLFKLIREIDYFTGPLDHDSLELYAKFLATKFSLAEDSVHSLLGGFRTTVVFDDGGKATIPDRLDERGGENLMHSLPKDSKIKAFIGPEGFFIHRE